jgi:hypothetical protein
MKRIVLLIILLSLIVLGQKGWDYYTKYRHAKRLKIGVDSVKLPKLNLTSLFSEVAAVVYLKITNFSESVFELQQIKIEVYSPNGYLVAEQTEPLAQTIRIEPNQKNILPLSFLISPTKFKALIKEAGGVVNVGASYLTEGNYGIPLNLRGFVVAEGVTISVNEKLVV